MKEPANNPMDMMNSQEHKESTKVVIILSTIFEKIFTKILESMNKSGGELL